MNKYFLPVYNSQLKPWIKWWILKRLNGGESTLKAVTISSGTLTKVDKSMGLSIKEYYGNTVQNGTPTPESPVEIQTISGNITFNINSVNYNLDLKSRNLFDKSVPFTTSGNLLVSSQIYLNGTFTLSSNILYGTTYENSSEIFLVKEGESATTSGNGVGRSNYRTYICNGNYTIQVRGNNTTAEEISSGTKWIMLEEGSEATPYESYYNYELCKIGDFKDKIYNDNGTWKIEKKVGKVVLNGSESWAINRSGTANWYYYANISSININTDSTSSNTLCDHYTWGSVGVSNTNTGYYIVKNGGQVRIRYGTEDTVANYKAWLGSNNVTLYYALSTPTTETITNENLIQQLNTLYEFYVESSTVTISNNSEIPLEVLLEYYGR